MTTGYNPCWAVYVTTSASSHNSNMLFFRPVSWSCIVAPSMTLLLLNASQLRRLLCSMKESTRNTLQQANCLSSVVQSCVWNPSCQAAKWYSLCTSRASIWHLETICVMTLKVGQQWAICMKTETEASSVLEWILSSPFLNPLQNLSRMRMNVSKIHLGSNATMLSSSWPKFVRLHNVDY